MEGLFFVIWAMILASAAGGSVVGAGIGYSLKKSKKHALYGGIIGMPLGVASLKAYQKVKALRSQAGNKEWQDCLAQWNARMCAKDNTYNVCKLAMACEAKAKEISPVNHLRVDLSKLPKECSLVHCVPGRRHTIPTTARGTPSPPTPPTTWFDVSSCSIVDNKNPVQPTSDDGKACEYVQYTKSI